MNRNPIVTATWSALFAGVLVPGLLGCDPAGKPTLTDDSPQHGAESSNHAAHPADDSPSGQMHAVMMHPMDDFKLTGNVDQDFAALMIPHHQGAIDMAQIELDHGKNEELKKMARAIMDAQAKEIAILKQYAPAGSSSESGNPEESSPSGSATCRDDAADGQVRTHRRRGSRFCRDDDPASPRRNRHGQDRARARVH